MRLSTSSRSTLEGSASKADLAERVDEVGLNMHEMTQTAKGGPRFLPVSVSQLVQNVGRGS